MVVLTMLNRLIMNEVMPAPAHTPNSPRTLVLIVLVMKEVVPPPRPSSNPNSHPNSNPDPNPNANSTLSGSTWPPHASRPSGARPSGRAAGGGGATRRCSRALRAVS